MVEADFSLKNFPLRNNIDATGTKDFGNEDLSR